MPKKRSKAKSRKSTRRARIAARARSTYASPKTKILGRSAKNVAIGAALVNGSTRLAGPTTARLGVYSLPANLAIAGLVGTFMGSGQKDLISTAAKIAGSRFITTQIEPRLNAMSTPGTGGPGRRNGGGY